ncbi:MAG: hypothetical protein AAFN10_11045 [Bacteroidota bacterium]
MKTLLCLLTCLPSLLWAQTAYQSEISLQLVGLGLGAQYEYAWGQRSSTALMYTVDYQNIGEGREIWGSFIQLHYKYRLGGKEAPNEIQSGVIFSVFAEHAFRRSMEYYKEDMYHQSSGLGLMAGYRLLPGKKKRFSFSVLLGVKYMLPHLNIPQWYQGGRSSFGIKGFRPQLSVGIGWKTQKRQNHE